jgi:hypothetical protein
MNAASRNTVYFFRAQVDDYQSICPVREEDWDVFRSLDGVPRAGNWRPIALEVVDDPDVISLPAGDFPYLANHVPVFSDRAFAALSGALGNCVEFLPVVVGTQTYYAGNVTRLVDALDKQQSIIKRFESTGRVMRVAHHEFVPRLLVNELLFRLPETPLMDVFATGRFAELVEASGLVGFEFEAVP